MKLVHILVEGQSEETFIKEVLAQHLYTFDLNLIPIIVKTKKLQKGPQHKGGLVNYDHLKRDLKDLLQNKAVDKVTTMFDLYALPGNFPKLGEIYQKGVEKALELEKALFEDVNHPKLLPYIQVHEFETLLFSDVSKFALDFSEAEVRQLQEIAAMFSSPEDINETSEGAPSKRIFSVLGKKYQKTLHGPYCQRYLLGSHTS
ncbi:MAG: DUF4276 family protein [Deinococcales bacterium]